MTCGVAFCISKPEHTHTRHDTHTSFKWFLSHRSIFLWAVLVHFFFVWSSSSSSFAECWVFFSPFVSVCVCRVCYVRVWLFRLQNRRIAHTRRRHICFKGTTLMSFSLRIHFIRYCLGYLYFTLSSTFPRLMLLHFQTIRRTHYSVLGTVWIFTTMQSAKRKAKAQSARHSQCTLFLLIFRARKYFFELWINPGNEKAEINRSYVNSYSIFPETISIRFPRNQSEFVSGQQLFFSSLQHKVCQKKN